MVHCIRHNGRERFGDPEGMPHAVCTQKMAQYGGQRHDENNVAAQRNDQRFCAFAQTLQCAAGGGGKGGHHKAQTDDAQGGLTGIKSLGVGSKQLHQRAGGEQADARAGCHDGCAHDKSELIELFHTGVLPGTVVVADERAHTLHDAVGGQIQKGLQLIVDAQHHHIALGECSQQTVQEGDQQGWQSQIEDRRYADAVKFFVQRSIRAQAAAAHPHRELSAGVDEKVNAQTEQLTDAGSQRCARNAHGGHRAKAEDEDGVEDDIAHTAEDQCSHGHLHAAHRLKHLFKGQCSHIDGSKQEHDGGVGDAGGDQAFVPGEPAQKARHNGNADDRDENAVQKAQSHAVGGGGLGFLTVACAEMQRDHGVDADAKADGNGVGKILDGEHQRQGGHGILTDARHKQAVHNVVQAVHQHGNDIGQRHGHQQRQHRFFFHKSLVHNTTPKPKHKKPHNDSRKPLCGEK